MRTAANWSNKRPKSQGSSLTPPISILQVQGFSSIPLASNRVVSDIRHGSVAVGVCPRDPIIQNWILDWPSGLSLKVNLPASKLRNRTWFSMMRRYFSARPGIERSGVTTIEPIEPGCWDIVAKKLSIRPRRSSEHNVAGNSSTKTAFGGSWPFAPTLNAMSRTAVK